MSNNNGSDRVPSRVVAKPIVHRLNAAMRPEYLTRAPEMADLIGGGPKARDMADDACHLLRFFFPGLRLRTGPV